VLTISNLKALKQILGVFYKGLVLTTISFENNCSKWWCS